MSLFPDEDVLTREIETWRGFIDKLPSDEDKLEFYEVTQWLLQILCCNE